MQSLKRVLLNPLIKSISRREEDLRLRVGLMHVSINRKRAMGIKQLWDAEVKVFSQWGEDGILDFLFEELGMHKPKILELGAGCFAECNSKFAAHARNASVYAVDARSDLGDGVKNSGLIWRNTIGFESIEIHESNILGIENRAKVLMSGLDTISLDLDGNDYWIAKNLDLIDVKIVCVEFNPIFGLKDVTVINSTESRWERHYSGLLFGASLSAWIALFSAKEFTFVGTNRAGNNAFFVANKEVERLSFELPIGSNIEKFLDWRCRESRDTKGELTYLDLSNSKALIEDCLVFDLKSGQVSTLREIR